MAKIGELYYDITAKDSGLAKVLGNIKKELKDADNAVVSFTKGADSALISAAFEKTGRTVEQMKNQLTALRSVWSKMATDDVAGQQRISDRYREISDELERLGVVMPKLIRTEMTFEKAMAMQSKTIGEMIAKQKALKEVRLQADVSSMGGRFQVEQINKEYGRLNNTLKEYGVKEQRVNETLLGKSRILSQVRNELGMYLSVYAAQRFLSEMIKIRGEYELQQTALGAILGSASDANKLFLQVQELGLKSPFSTLDLISYTKQLSAFKVATEELFDTTKALADISAGVGVDMSRLVLAFGQVRAASVLRGTEVRQFTEAGIPLVDELAKKFEELNGKAITTGEVFDKISARQVPFEMVRDILFDMTKAGGMFYNMQEVQAETLKGKVENLRDAYEKVLNTIGKTGGVLGAGVDITRALITNLDKFAKVLGIAVTAYGIYNAALLVDNVTSLTSIGIRKKQIAINALLTKSVESLNLAMFANPWVFATAAILTLVGSFLLLKNSLTETEAAALRFNDRMNKIKDGVDDQRRAADKLINTVRDETSSYKEKAVALQELKRLYPDIFKNINLHALSTAELTKVQRKLNEELQKEIEIIGAGDLEKLRSQKQQLELRMREINDAQTLSFLTNQLRKVNADINYLVQQRADKEEKDLLQTIYEQGQEWEKMPSYIKTVNKTITELGLSMKRVSPDVSLDAWMSEMKDNYSAAKKTIEELGGTVADVSGGIVEDAKNTVRELDTLSKATGFSFDSSKKGGTKKQATTYEDKMYRKEIKLEQELLQSQILLEKQKVETLEDGKEKRLAIIELEYKEELAKINKQRDDVLIAYNERNKLKGANRITKSNMGMVMPDEFGTYTASSDAAQRARRVKVTKEEQDSAMELKKIMTDVTAYQKKETDAQIADIGVKYDEIYKKAKLAGASEMELLQITASKANEQSSAKVQGFITGLDREQEIALQENDLLWDGIGMQEVAEREKLRILIKYSEERLKLLQTLGDEESKQQAKVLAGSISGMKKDLGKKTITGSLNESLTKGLNKAFENTGKSADEAKEKTSKLLTGIQQGGSYAADGIAILQSAFGGMSEEADMAMEAVGAIAEGFATGGLAGGIMAAAQQALSITAKLITAKKEVDQSMIEGYKAYIEVLNELIDEQIELLDSLGMKDFAKGINDAYDDIASQIRATMVLFRETANSGQGTFSRSIGYKANKETKKFANQLREIGIYQTDISKMTASQLVSLKQIPLLYAKLPKELTEYIDNLDEAVDKQKELDEQIRDMILGFDYSDITTAIVDSLTDPSIDNALGDLGAKIDEFIADTVKNILIKTFLTEQLEKAVDAFWHKIAKKNFAGNIVDFEVTPEDAKDFKDDVLNASNNFKEGWGIVSDQMKDVGIDMNNAGIAGDTERQGLSKGIATASQESIDALTGGVYAVMDAVNVTRNNSIITVNSLGNINEELKTQTVIIRELANLTVKIQSNTEFNKHLQYISANIADINTKGLKLKE